MIKRMSSARVGTTVLLGGVLVLATSARADDASGPELYAYDGGYYAAPQSAYPSSATPFPAGQGMGMQGLSATPRAIRDVMPSGMVGPQVPPMPQMPSWVQAWAGEMSDVEREQLEDVYKGLRRINHALTGELMDASDLISDALKSERRDPKSVGQAYGRYFDIQRRWIEAQIAAANRVDELIADVRARVSQVPPPVSGMPMAAPGGIGTPIVIPPVPESEPEVTEIPAPEADQP